VEIQFFLTFFFLNFNSVSIFKFIFLSAPTYASLRQPARPCLAIIFGAGCSTAAAAAFAAPAASAALTA